MPIFVAFRTALPMRWPINVCVPEKATGFSCVGEAMTMQSVPVPVRNPEPAALGTCASRTASVRAWVTTEDASMDAAKLKGSELCTRMLIVPTFGFAKKDGSPARTPLLSPTVARQRVHSPLHVSTTSIQELTGRPDRKPTALLSIPSLLIRSRKSAVGSTPTG